MATDKELSDFLENVERRAFKQAVYAVRKDEAALDIVQDAMIKLAEKYGDKPAAELPMLFQRILQNTILDYFRREKVRSSWVSICNATRRSRSRRQRCQLAHPSNRIKPSVLASASHCQPSVGRVLKQIAPTRSSQVPAVRLSSITPSRSASGCHCPAP